MALGYEGHIKVGSTYVLGTGSSVPRNRNRMEASSAYGGTINGSDRAIGLPRNYDWEVFDGAVNFEMTAGLFTSELKPWLFDRQSAREIFFAPRESAQQQFTKSFFSSISISASDGGLVDGSVGFVALDRDTYAYGSKYIDNKEGDGLLCGSSGFPDPLNETPLNQRPVPFWNTKVTLAGADYEFITWSLEVSQEVVKFFACEGNTTVQEPKYLAVGPMSITLSGSMMADFPDASAPLAFPADELASASVEVAGNALNMTLLESQTESDDVQAGDSMTPLNIEYAVYGIS